MRFDIAPALVDTPRPPQWVLPRMLPSGTLVALAGDPGVGKSWLGYWLSFLVATGGLFLGQPVQQGKVLYFDQENSLPDTSEYLRQVWHGLGCPPPPLLTENFILECYSLNATKWAQQMTALAAQHHPRLVIIDTVTPACDIQDESDNAEATRVIQALRKVRQAAGEQCCLVALRHAKLHFDTGREGGPPKRSMRGAKAWHGACDQVLFLVNAASGRPSKKLKPTRLEPDKVRAWGLEVPIVLTPTRMANGGVVLTAMQEKTS